MSGTVTLPVLQKRRFYESAFLSCAGPAFMAAVAYIDPGNFATNIQAGSKYGYGLLWVVLLANIMAMVFQALSAKLGLVTGHSLPELCRQHFPRPLVWGMWIISELAAMATDVAEFIGGALGFSLLLNIPMPLGMALTAVLSLFILGLRSTHGIERTITLLAAIIGVCFLAELWLAPVNWGLAVQHTLAPRLADQGALLLAVGIVGATVMPHAIYLHSGLMRQTPQTRHLSLPQRLQASNREVKLALGLAGLINLAMVLMAAAVYKGEVAQLETAYRLLTPLLGAAAGGFFLTSLMASGVASSSVGLLAGDMIMQGFVHKRIPLWVRRVVNILPAAVIVAMGLDVTHALVLSQVMLSLALPVPLLTLLYFTQHKRLMGTYTNGRMLKSVAWTGAAIILLLNGILIWQTVSAVWPGQP
jgi:manganese transport protein